MNSTLQNHNKFKFVDLFAGIGGFHQAMKRLGGECVFAAEINPETALTYKNNYNINALCDLVRINPEDIPEHEVLCAGFPCQSFSKAGFQKGFNDVRGTLFFEIIKILKNHIKRYGGPQYLILENVRNLISHDKGNTWNIIKSELTILGYNVVKSPIIASPHYFGVPQLRERALILAVKKNIYGKEISLSLEKKDKNRLSIDKIILNESDEYDLNVYKLSDYEEKLLKMWDEFIKGIDRKIIGFPVWSDYFFLDNESTSSLPAWKLDFIRKNKELYNSNKKFIDNWYNRYGKLKWVKKTHRKFEWQVDNKISTIFDGIIQFRPSGVRVKQPTEFPALVAMVHIPIIGKYHRYITPREAARLQSFPDSFKIPKNDRLAYKQFGNAVNVEVIYNVFKLFLDLVGEDKNGH